MLDGDPATRSVATGRGWRVLLVCGASGVGKSRISYPLARHYGVPLVEVDDIVEALRAVTTPDQLPLLHYWDTHPEARHLAAEEIVALQIALAESLSPAIAAIIGNHLETDTPVVIEGDFIVPALAMMESVAGIVVTESSTDQLVANYLQREPGAGEQTVRATVSRLYGDWLVEQAAAHGVPCVSARPWDGVLDRVRRILGDD